MQGRRSPEDPEAEELRSCIKIIPNLVEHLRSMQYAPLLYGVVHTVPTTVHGLHHPIQHFGF